MTLLADPPAAPVFGPIEILVLAPGQVAMVSGLVDARAPGDAGIVLLIANFLPGIDLSVGHASLGAALLVVQSLVYFIDARMTWYGRIGGRLRHDSAGSKCSGENARDQARTKSRPGIHGRDLDG
ncbi:MAG: hypothetical protein WC617_15795 [Rhodanobacter sp.]